MPIRWSAVKVSQDVDEIEQLFNSVTPTLWRIREKAGELRGILSASAASYPKRHWRRNARLWSMADSNR
jgi:hypothetical protein